MGYVFEWNERKNEANRRKHGVSFEQGASVFDDIGLLLEFDRTEDNGEERFHATGHDPNGAMLLVVHIYKGRNENGEEKVRIISARKASDSEVGRYFQQAAE